MKIKVFHIFSTHSFTISAPGILCNCCLSKGIFHLVNEKRYITLAKGVVLKEFITTVFWPSTVDFSSRQKKKRWKMGYLPSMDSHNQPLRGNYKLCNENKNPQNPDFSFLSFHTNQSLCFCAGFTVCVEMNYYSISPYGHRALCY